MALMLRIVDQNGNERVVDVNPGERVPVDRGETVSLVNTGEAVGIETAR